MVFVLLGLAVFGVTKVFTEFLVLPRWALLLIIMGISAAGLAIAGENPGWCPAVSALAGFVYWLDGLFQALRDWVRLQVLRGPTRR